MWMRSDFFYFFIFIFSTLTFKPISQYIKSFLSFLQYYININGSHSFHPTAVTFSSSAASISPSRFASFPFSCLYFPTQCESTGSHCHHSNPVVVAVMMAIRVMAEVLVLVGVGLLCRTGATESSGQALALSQSPYYHWCHLRERTALIRYQSPYSCH